MTEQIKPKDPLQEEIDKFLRDMLIFAIDNGFQDNLSEPLQLIILQCVKENFNIE